MCTVVNAPCTTRVNIAFSLVGMDPTQLVEQIQAAAAKRGLKRSGEIADALGVPKQNWTNWKKRGVPKDKYGLAADFCGKSVDEFLGRSKPADAGPMADIPQHRIDLIRMYGRLLKKYRTPIRMLIESLAGEQHPGRPEHEKLMREFTENHKAAHAPAKAPKGKS